MRNIFKTTLLILISVVCITMLLPKYSHAKRIFKVKDGVVDLSNWNPETDGKIALNGNWKFYWEQFVKPEAFATSSFFEKKTELINVPGVWSSLVVPGTKNVKRSPDGYATYALKIKGLTPEKYKKISFEFELAFTAYNAYFVQENYKASKHSPLRPFMHSGVVSKNAKDEIPYRVPRFKNMEVPTSTAYIVFHVSNHSLNMGGMSRPVYINKEIDVIAAFLDKYIVGLMATGVLLAMALYHLLVFMLRREDIGSLFFGLMSAVLALRHVMTERYIFSLLPEASLLKFGIFFRLEYVTIYVGVPLFYAHVNNLFKKEGSAKFAKFLWIVSPFFLAGSLFLDYPQIAAINMYYQAIILTMGSMVIYCLIKAAFKKRMGAKLSLFTFFLLFLATINDIMFSQQLIHTMFLIPFGVVIFTLAQSFILASLFKNAYRTAEHLTSHLKEEVDRQTVELKNNNLKLKELDKQKTHFFQNVSHELRTPLTLIMNPLNNELKKAPDNKNVEVAAKNSKRLFRLVNQLLDFQKASSKKNKLVLSHIDVIQFVKTCGDYFESSCKNKKIKFVFDIETSKVISILGHVDALEKVVFNYLSNALKYTPENGTIVLSVSIIDRRVRICVKDTGIGISKDDSEKLFKVFSQVDDSAVRDYEGTGLGLALVKELVSEMKGEVGVDSRLDFGSTFFAEFPISKSEKPLIDILIVDDDNHITDHLQSGLEMSLPNITCKTASNADSARKILDMYNIKVFATDYNMPGEDGVTLLKHVSRTQPDSKKVLMTGNIDPSIIQTAINEVKIDNVQYKPLNIGEFSEIIEGLLELSQVKEIEKVELDKYSPKDWHLAEEQASSKDGDLDDDDDNDTVQDSDKELIIVIDDIPDMRKLIAKDIAEHGYRTITACDGVDGYEKIMKHKPNLIIADWMMPKMSGPELVEKLQGNDELSTIPTILLTAKNDEESKLLGTQTGATAYLGKPFDELELISTIKNLLHLKDGEKKIKELNKHISENILKRFLPPSIVDQIVDGKESLDDKPKMLPVTVLFSDLSEFTSKTTLLGPNKMLRILNAYLEEMTNVIFECGGNIDKFIGDSIMVIFGAPNPLNSQDQAMKAHSCALKMQMKLAELNEKWKEESLPEFKMRIGIHHGPAIVGYLGSNKRTDYTAIGSTVNLAARIEGAADDGEIFISETFRDLLSEGTWERAGLYELKGFSNKVTLFKITTEISDKKAA